MTKSLLKAHAKRESCRGATSRPDRRGRSRRGRAPARGRPRAGGRARARGARRRVAVDLPLGRARRASLRTLVNVGDARPAARSASPRTRSTRWRTIPSLSRLMGEGGVRVAAVDDPDTDAALSASCSRELGKESSLVGPDDPRRAGLGRARGDHRSGRAAAVRAGRRLPARDRRPARRARSTAPSCSPRSRRSPTPTRSPAWRAGARSSSALEEACATPAGPGIARARPLRHRRPEAGERRRRPRGGRPRAVRARPTRWSHAAGGHADAVVGRFGGDEFCVLLPSGTAEDARAVALDAVRRLERPGGERISCGVAARTDERTGPPSCCARPTRPSTGRSARGDDVDVVVAGDPTGASRPSRTAATAPTAPSDPEAALARELLELLDELNGASGRRAARARCARASSAPREALTTQYWRLLPPIGVRLSQLDGPQAHRRARARPRAGVARRGSAASQDAGCRARDASASCPARRSCASSRRRRGRAARGARAPPAWTSRSSLSLPRTQVVSFDGSVQRRDRAPRGPAGRRRRAAELPLPRAGAAPNDTHFGHLWGLGATPGVGRAPRLGPHARRRPGDRDRRHGRRPHAPRPRREPLDRPGRHPRPWTSWTTTTTRTTSTSTARTWPAPPRRSPTTGWAWRAWRPQAQIMAVRVLDGDGRRHELGHRERHRLRRRRTARA